MKFNLMRTLSLFAPPSGHQTKCLWEKYIVKLKQFQFAGFCCMACIEIGDFSSLAIGLSILVLVCKIAASSLTVVVISILYISACMRMLASKSFHMCSALFN